MRGKTRKLIQWRTVAALAFVALLTGTIGVAEGAGADAGVRSASSVATWNNTGSNCTVCTPIS
ncbi:hypothetical protein [Streptomyces sp. NPDC059371]|uniref:hypothetical protein n=1 Tax=Streptomyces sp. NPDC059371 TaxID=3346812 RepID=UPI0036770A4C